MQLSWRYSALIYFLSFSSVIGILMPVCALARDLQYSGTEVSIYVEPGTPTQITFPGRVLGGFKKKKSGLTIEKHDDVMIVIAQPELTDAGEAIIVHLEGKRSYAFRVKRANPTSVRDELITITDLREPVVDTEETETLVKTPQEFASFSTVSGLMRELILVAEFGKKTAIPGYRRSNRYTGEVLLNDGALEAKIDQIFMGPNLWGYVINVTNLLDTPQRINPATFRLDGTMAVNANRWELARRPVTTEQQTAKAHIGKVYIITRTSGDTKKINIFGNTRRDTMRNLKNPLLHIFANRGFWIGGGILLVGILVWLSLVRRSKKCA